MIANPAKAARWYLKVQNDGDEKTHFAVGTVRSVFRPQIDGISSPSLLSQFVFLYSRHKSAINKHAARRRILMSNWHV